MKKHKEFAVIGGGSWATAIVKMLCESLPRVHWYMRNTQAIEHIRNERHNPNYLSSVELNPNQLALTDDINEAVSRAECIIFAVPSAFVSSELSSLKISLEDKIVYSAIKGIVPESGLIVGEHFQKYHGVSEENFGVLSGPCHAEEVALERLSYLTVGSKNTDNAILLAEVLDSHYIRCIVSEDVLGIEYAAMLKNIYALAAGIYHTLGYGDNFQSVLMSNAIRETERFIKKVNQTPRNITDSVYLGDLLVTGYSIFSRNRMLGAMIGKGYTVQSALVEMNMVAEGYYAAKCAYELNESLEDKADIPIIETVYKILYKNKNPKNAMFQLTRYLY